MIAPAHGLIARWAHLYESRKALSAITTFVHLGGVLLGGGAAVVADREALQVREMDAAWTHELARWRRVHRWVIAGLVLTALSGIAMFFSDVDTFLPSVLYWTKMSLIVLLLANGYVRLRAERVLERGPSGALRTFRVTSVLSLVLWFAILLAGAFLPTL